MLGGQIGVYSTTDNGIVIKWGIPAHNSSGGLRHFEETGRYVEETGRCTSSDIECR